ncbi:uncharacterized protein LOC141906083 [Tubulanus polymorphus]|uniref:uncharacterized protein LOC141906083 n=1 Tax=Tubulanus polymorphus TaxID=672921 RepID=UPI003DA49B7A
MTMSIAFNTFLMVVMDKKISFGAYDWRLWLVPMVIPFITGITGVAIPYFGPSGAWCFIDSRVKWKEALNMVHSIIMVLVFFINGILYAMAWWRIKLVAKRLQTYKTSDSINRQRKLYLAAYSMTVFVSAYVLQYSTLVMYSIWALVSVPSVPLIMATVFFTNMGGFFNFSAYTVFRRYTTRSGTKKDESSSTNETPSTKSSGVGHTSSSV